MVNLADKQFHVHSLDDAGELGDYIGAADTEASAVQVAAALWTGLQNYSPSGTRLIVVLDSTGQTVAWIGKNPQQAP